MHSEEQSILHLDGETQSIRIKIHSKDLSSTPALPLITNS